MKKYILLIMICSILPMIGYCTNPIEGKNTKPIFTKLLEDEDIDSYQIPTFLVKVALSFSDESKEILPLFKGSHSINIAVCDNQLRDYDESFKRVCKRLDISSYINLVDIVDCNSKITIKALLNDKIIRELVILIHDENSLIAVSMTGKIDPQSIAETIVKLNKPKSDRF